MILFAMLWTAFTMTMVQGELNMKDCKERNFEPKACKVSKVMNDHR